MTINSKTNQTADWVKREELTGQRLDTGPYIGIVKENRDPMLAGRIQIWIPEYGGIETDPKYWRTVSYAGPYMGSTVQEPFAEEAPRAGASDKNSFKTVRHTYGMWFNVPDLENWVLCTFVGGDPARGYWFACIPNQLGHHMIPAMGASTNYQEPDDPVLKKIVKSGEPYPVVEFNEYSKTVNWEEIQNNKKPIHEKQLKILVEQGLDRKSLTKSRGIIESSSQRESPSGVFGFSTPGRSLSPVNANGLAQERKVKTRLGGHTFVMDDGDEKGNNNLTRWRSAGGHQILMDDTEQIIYITNSTGSSWIEMNASGHLNVYSSNSINFRTKKEINLHADSNFNINVGGSFNLNVKGTMNLQAASITAKGNKDVTVYGGSLKLGSGGRLDLYTSGGGSFTASQGLMMTGKTIGLNSGSGPTVNKPRDIAIKTSADTKKDGNGQWQVEENQLKSVATIVPAHEPWNRKAGTSSTVSNAVPDVVNDGVNIEQSDSPDATDYAYDYSTATDPGDETVAGIDYVSDPGIVEAIESSPPGNNELADESDMMHINSPSITQEVGPLNELEVKAVMVQASKTLSDGNFAKVFSNGALGAYGLQAKNLVESGLISRAAIDQYIKNPNSAMQDIAAWTGKYGIQSAAEFVSNKTVQDTVMIDNLLNNYKQGISTGCIKTTDTKQTVGGMLNLIHTTQVEAAKAWRQTGNRLVDFAGNSAEKMFQLGSYAVKRLGGGP